MQKYLSRDDLIYTEIYMSIFTSIPQEDRPGIMELWDIDEIANDLIFTDGKYFWIEATPEEFWRTVEVHEF